ncbi:MAG: cupin domain-containing protein [Hyphomonadaceae bacterium]
MRLTVIAFTASLAACTQIPATGSAWIGSIKFAPMGATNPGAFAATLDGNTNAAGPYTIRVHIEKGGRIAPHTHPDARVVTVVSGELCYGFGAEFDPDGCKLYPEGSYFVVPANAPHFGYGKSDAVYQESGVGPSGFVPVAK